MTSPWKDYPPTADNQPDTPDTPAPQRWLAVLVVLAVVCAIVMFFGGLPTLPAIGEVR